ncbi:MAG: ORF6N domain-containing protein [Bacteroidales bacterium]
MSKKLPAKTEPVYNLIYTVRGVQVMLDEDLAMVYKVDLKRLNEQVKRNSDRFPTAFRFQLTKEEWEILRSQIATLETKPKNIKSQIATLDDDGRGKHRKYLPYVFTEQGVSMLSAVLHSETAVKASIAIMNAFVEMRRLMVDHAALFQRMDRLELRLNANDQKFEQIFKALDSGKPEPVSGIFYDGQIFDAHAFVSDLIRKARKSLVLIDNYIDDTVFTLFLKRKTGVKVTFYTRNISPQLKLDAEKHKAQHAPVEVKPIAVAHDRFLIIDDTELYHIGASVKDLGKKWFAFSRMDTEVADLLKLLKIKINE